MVTTTDQYKRVASYAELKQKASMTVRANHLTLVLFDYGGQVYAVDNRCPHMGFPMDRGTLKDGILTCHWHHARFDLASGGTFDQWADDLDAYPVRIEGDDVLVDVFTKQDVVAYQRNRLRDGLERDISLVIAKSVINLLQHGVDPVEPFTVGVDFGTRYRESGWGRGLTTHSCTMNLIPFLNADDHPRALYHGLADIASETSGMAPRFCVRPLPIDSDDIPTLKRWFQQFVEVRDADAAERCILSAIRAGADDKQMADMMFAAATDHRYLDAGHTLDFINKGFEALDLTGWQYADIILSSHVPNLVSSTRMEETNAWRYPVDLVAILDAAFEQLPDILNEGASKQAVEPDYDTLIPTILDDDPQQTAESLLDALKNGVTPEALAGVVVYGAARRIAQFHTSNEFNDWDTALHTFTFANAVHQGLRRVNSADLARGIFDAAMSIYLDRFLNIPAVKLPQPTEKVSNPAGLLEEYFDLLDQQQQVNQAGTLVAKYLYSDGDPHALMAMMGRLLLREDRNFHTIQCVEGAFQQFTLNQDHPQRASHFLIAAARYLAAHAPTMRSQGQTYQIARRFSRNEKLFEGDE